MRRAEIDALVRAHRGRAHPVAFFHVLRQPALDEDDQAFLVEHADVLTFHDLLAWKARCAPGFTGVPIRRLAQMGIDDPLRFDHELLRAPRLDLAEEEWTELAFLLRGKVPDEVLERLAKRASERGAVPAAAPPGAPEEAVDLVALLEDALGDPGLAAAEPAPPIPATEAPEVILERARRAFSADERAMLLGWLSRAGSARRPLVEIALGSVRAGSMCPSLLTWLSGQLGTRAAWEAHGVDVFLAFIDPGAFAELEDLLAQTWSYASPPGETPGPPARPFGADASGKLLDAIHAAFAAGLIQAAREGMAGGDPGKALTALSALACLDPPPRLSRSIHDLARMETQGGELRVLIDLNARLVKHGRVHEASFGGVIAALQSLADARLPG